MELVCLDLAFADLICLAGWDWIHNTATRKGGGGASRILRDAVLSRV